MSKAKRSNPKPIDAQKQIDTIRQQSIEARRALIKPIESIRYYSHVLHRVAKDGCDRDTLMLGMIAMRHWAEECLTVLHAHGFHEQFKDKALVAPTSETHP